MLSIIVNRMSQMHLKTPTRDLITNFQVRKIESKMKRVKECNAAPNTQPLNIGMGTSLCTQCTVHVYVIGQKFENDEESFEFDILHQVQVLVIVNKHFEPVLVCCGFFLTVR